MQDLDITQCYTITNEVQINLYMPRALMLHRIVG